MRNDLTEKLNDSPRLPADFNLFQYHLFEEYLLFGSTPRVDDFTNWDLSNFSTNFAQRQQLGFLYI
jgi:hypothetical protein